MLYSCTHMAACWCYRSVLCFVQRFRECVLPNIEQLVSEDHIRSVHESGADIRTHLINARKYDLIQTCVIVDY